MSASTLPSEEIVSEDWRGIIAALACALITGAGLSISLPLFSILMEQSNVSATINGANTAVGGLSVLIVAPFISRMIIHFGISTLSKLSIALAIASLIGFWLTPPPWPWFPLRFLLGIATGLLFIISEFWINSLAKDQRRGLMMGLHGTILSIGFIIGPVILLITGTEGSAPFLVTILLFFLVAIPIHFAGNSIPRPTERPSKPFSIFLIIVPVATLAGFVFGAIESACHSLLPIYGVRLGYDKNHAMMMIIMVTMGGVIMQMPLGALSDRINRHLMLLCCGLISAITIAPLAIFTMPIQASYGLLIIFGGSTCGLYTIGLAHLASLFRGSDRISANAAFVMLHSLGMLIGPLTAGLGMDIWNPHGFIYIISSYFIIFSLLAGIYYCLQSAKMTFANPPHDP